MPSTLSWLDYSEHDRRQVLDVVDLFREHDTRDELGIGVVRDAFADIFFPGTSTIQTRAKYFLFIPWIYHNLEGRRIPSNQFELRARQEETRLIQELLRSGDQDGIIGKFAQKTLQRLPSAIYWQGLRQWGILLSGTSRDYYIRTIEATYRSGTRHEYGDDGSEPTDSRIRTWHTGLPPIPPEFPRGANFKLSPEEAEYLRDRILSHATRTLLAHLVDGDEYFDREQLLWQVQSLGDLPPNILEQLRHAESFSLVIWGAALLYNLMLGELLENDERISFYERLLHDWAAEVVNHSHMLSTWSRPRFWEIIFFTGARVPTLTRVFIDTWLDAVRDAGNSETTLVDLIRNPRIRTLIHDRERSLKRGQARLDNQRALELWNGAAGAARLTYRWQQAGRIISDIRGGLERPSDA